MPGSDAAGLRSISATEAIFVSHKNISIVDIMIFKNAVSMVKLLI